MQIVTRIFNPPPPTPCSTLASIKFSILTATPHSKLPTKNTVMAISSSGLRPQMSLSFAHIGVVTAVAST